MESYIFADDLAARAVADALSERAAAGLDVRLMVDGWGSLGTPAALFNRMQAAGVAIHFFHSPSQVPWGAAFFEVMNQRNHRKLLVVDDRIAYFGGMNVVDQGGGFPRTEPRPWRLSASAGWRDVHVRMVGARQAEIAATCQRLWNRVHHWPNEPEPEWPDRFFWRSPSESIFFFDSRPKFRNRRPQRILTPLIRQARREITLSFAYFIPSGRMLRALFKARKRGVRVRVIVPGQSDVKIVQWASRHFYAYLLKRGIRIHERKDRMLHGKVMVIDKQWSVIGSCNLDARSLRWNLEFFAVLHSPPLALALDKICQEDIRGSERITIANYRRRWWWQRWLDRAAWALRKWL